MEKLSVIKKIPKSQRGVSLLDSLVALAIFGTVMGLYFNQQEQINQEKTAKSYATETLNYTKEYVDYLNSTRSQKMAAGTKNAYLNTSWYKYYKNYLKTNGGVVYLSPEQVFEYANKGEPPSTPNNSWSSNLRRKSIFNETPCLALSYDTKTDNMYGIMYYAGGVSIKDKQTIAIKAGRTLKSKALMYVIQKDGAVKTFGGSNWNPNIAQLTGGKNICGGNLSPNSPIVNLNMFLGFNQRMLQINSILKTNDQQYNSNSDTNNFYNVDPKYLPGHLLNNNTIKSNLSLTNNNSVILDKAKNISVGIAYAGINNAATLNMGNSTSSDTTVLLTDTIQPNSTYQSGQSCDVSEVGKTVIDAGNPNNDANDSIAKKLAKNILVCSNNSTLCLNTGNYCYLPAVQNKFNFSNTNGIADVNGNFMCPAYAPYASNAYSVNNTPNVTVFSNQGGIVTAGAVIQAHLDRGNRDGGGWVDQYIGNEGRFDYSASYTNWYWITELRFDVISGSPSINIPNTTSNYITRPTANSSYVNVGYSVRQTSLGNCTTVCQGLNTILGTAYTQNGWQDVNVAVRSVGTGRAGVYPTISGIPNNSCGCAKMNSHYMSGVALVTPTSTTLQSINCSNVPDYNL